MIQIQKTPITPDFHLSRQVSLLLFPSSRPRYASCSLTWELDAASGFEFLLPLTSGFPEAVRFAGPFDAIGSFADEELAETIEDKFIAIGLDFATILSSSFCSCILFAIVLGQLIKLEFFTQQAELKWLMLDKWRRLFHSSRVKLPSVKMSASLCWCRSMFPRSEF